MTAEEPWLGHHDLCSIAYSEYCDCLPGEPVYLGDAEDAETEGQENRGGESL